MENNINNKYPISKNNRNCIGPCYEPNKFVIHPVLLKFVTGIDNQPFCPTNIYDEVDEKGNKYQSAVDVCFKPTANILDENMDILYPNIIFDPKTFLIAYYDIKNYQESLDWLNKNSHLPLNTKLRIVECTWTAFFENIYLIDKAVIECYNKYFVNKIKEIYSNLYDLIDIDIKKNQIILKKNNLEMNKYNVERINFINEKLLSEEEIEKFFNRYFDKNKELLKKEHNITSNFQINYILKSFIIYLRNKLENSI
jgi:hypothetical protein